MILFSILNHFKIKNKIKKNVKVCARDPRGCDVARKAMWQRHADPRSAYMAHFIFIVFILLLYIYKMGLQPSLAGKGY